MIYRNFRRISTGQWLDVLLAVGGEDFSVPVETHRDQIATGFNITLADVQVVDGLADARTGVLIPAPAPVPPPLTAEQQTWAIAPVAMKLSMIGKRLGFEV